MGKSTPRKIVVIQGHPDPAGNRLCHALADGYAEGAISGGHDVQRIEIATLDFPLLRTQTDFEDGTIPAVLSQAWEAIRSADHIVLIFPLWLGTMPALVKAFLEQVARPGYAFAYNKNGFPTKLLAGRSARLVVTMGMPALVYRVWYFAHGLRGLERSILNFVGIAPIRESLFGLVGVAKEAKRKRWLEQMWELGRRGL
ncbi:MAG: flavodoxin family protein [Rhodospirillaceae bacterium]|nr:MAG: flavodoxin family protein [Rhodospirillaceae bacterium]